MNVPDTVDHFIKRCPGRARERRTHFGRERRLSVEELCTKRPNQILGYINDLGFLPAQTKFSLEKVGSHN